MIQMDYFEREEAWVRLLGWREVAIMHNWLVHIFLLIRSVLLTISAYPDSGPFSHSENFSLRKKNALSPSHLISSLHN